MRRAGSLTEWVVLAVLWPLGLPLVLLARPRWSVGRRYVFLAVSGSWAVLTLAFAMTLLGVGTRA